MKPIVMAILPDSYWVRYVTYLPMRETWIKKQEGKQPMFANRFLLYDFVNKECVSGKTLQYLEFGVYSGESIKYFAGINSDSASKFIGFDTFTGLPEDWMCALSITVKGRTFDTGGKHPETDDERISFVQGMFQDSLPAFLENFRQSSNQLVVHIDCDLYSSTLYVLTSANYFLVPGTIIIFDEFYSVMHEFRALDDYCSSCMRSYDVIAATDGFAQIAIRMR